MAQDADATVKIARLALNGAGGNATLQGVIEYTFDQLCWRMGEPELDLFLTGLRAKLGADA